MLALSTPGYAEKEEFKSADWDQVANIKDAAQRLAKLQRTKGAQGAFSFIDACYRTHSLASKYSKAFEACIAQDYMQTQVLMFVYSRLTPEELKRTGVPSPKALASAMGQRFSAAFESYKVPIPYVKDFKNLVDEHGFPVFFRIVFPGAPVPERRSGTLEPEQE